MINGFSDKVEQVTGSVEYGQTDRQTDRQTKTNRQNTDDKLYMYLPIAMSLNNVNTFG